MKQKTAVMLYMLSIQYSILHSKTIKLNGNFGFFCENFYAMYENIHMLCMGQYYSFLEQGFFFFFWI